jgi:hypothetical protein
MESFSSTSDSGFEECIPENNSEERSPIKVTELQSLEMPLGDIPDYMKEGIPMSMENHSLEPDMMFGWKP